MNQKCKASGSLGKQKSGEAEVKEKGAGRRREGDEKESLQWSLKCLSSSHNFTDQSEMTGSDPCLLDRRAVKSQNTNLPNYSSRVMKCYARNSEENLQTLWKKAQTP
jgi:hypothetical protein